MDDFAILNDGHRGPRRIRSIPLREDTIDSIAPFGAEGQRAEQQ